MVRGNKTIADMKTRLLLFAVAIIAMGCQETIENVALTNETNSFNAEIEVFGNDTKTSMDELRNIVWSENDQLAIFQGCSVADKYQITDETAGTGNGRFTLVSDRSGDVNDDFVSGVEISTNIALYPYSDELSVTNATISNEDNITAYAINGFIIPETQNYVANSFGEGTFPMVAITEAMSDHTLKFKNVLGAIKLQLKGTQTVKSIKIEGKNNEKLSGAATITAYPTGYTPTLTMADNANAFVTLDCGTGVELDESTNTDFIIALPPVLFSQGFTVTVTDSENATYVVDTDKANTVLRSSILTMPSFILDQTYEDSEEEDDELVIPVYSIELSSSSFKLYATYTTNLTATVRPKDATDQNIVWSSDDTSVATVDQAGKVTGISAGTATISAAAGGVVATCNVTVKALSLIDYIDEYEVNHKKGIVIGGTIWAPVNCGYHAEDFKYGKMYQWGRSFGQGYSGSVFDIDGNDIGEYSDNKVPMIEEGGVSVLSGNNINNADIFYLENSEYHDWVDPTNDKLWNSGTEVFPIKTEYDPCPNGWRVPTSTELKELIQNHSIKTTDKNGQIGYWFSGMVSYSEEVSQIFFPAAGTLSCENGNGDVRGLKGFYWSSTPHSFEADQLQFWGSVYMSYMYRSSGKSVRCVQE